MCFDKILHDYHEHTTLNYHKKYPPWYLCHLSDFDLPLSAALPTTPNNESRPIGGLWRHVVFAKFASPTKQNIFISFTLFTLSDNAPLNSPPITLPKRSTTRECNQEESRHCLLLLVSCDGSILWFSCQWKFTLTPRRCTTPRSIHREGRRLLYRSLHKQNQGWFAVQRCSMIRFM